MKLAKAIHKTSGQVVFGILDEDSITPVANCQSLSELLEQDDVSQFAVDNRSDGACTKLADLRLVAPVDAQEIWAAGVTYTRSKAARMEESEAAASCYDRVYVSDRPELFLKATPHRVVGPDDPIRIRYDATWNVPEPELTLVVNSRKELVGFTIGNDMSSRDIEGDNPLYLPQAKVYNQCCGVGPCITLADAMPGKDEIGIRLIVSRDGKPVFEDSTSVAQMARSFEDLIHWLGRDSDFPDGVFLLTGTGIVPDSSFTLQSDDIVTIEIDGIGSLTNTVVQNK
ncbi:MAG: fumarylacetoacetate hydrolase family protein [Planctomycetales bacterium]|nr:fumarylacetoacetate hydrolase family protein [Planctomycetales bacterium]